MRGVPDTQSKLDYAKPDTESAPRKRPGELPPWVAWVVIVASVMGVIAGILFVLYQFLRAAKASDPFH